MLLHKYTVVPAEARRDKTSQRQQGVQSLQTLMEHKFQGEERRGSC